MAEQPQLPGTQWFKGEFRPVTSVQQFARQYTESRGLPYRHGPDEIAKVRADPNEIASLGAEVQRQSGRETGVSPEMAQSYEAFNRDVNDQYDFMTRPSAEGGMGIKPNISTDDTHKSPMDLRDEVERGELSVYATRADPNYSHPALPADVNDRFRAVHDVFGHIATGRNFSRHGEAGAFEHHRQMFSPEARLAMTSETKAQNSGLVWSSDFVANKPYPATTEAHTQSYLNPAQSVRSKPRQRHPGQGTLPL